jgi:hypothetical protein
MNHSEDFSPVTDIHMEWRKKHKGNKWVTPFSLFVLNYYTKRLTSCTPKNE